MVLSVFTKKLILRFFGIFYLFTITKSYDVIPRSP